MSNEIITKIEKANNHGYRNPRTCEICCGLGVIEQSSSSKISYFRFPKDPILRKKWVQFCELEEDCLPKYPILCSLHFNPNQIIAHPGRCYLVKGAVPVFYDYTTNKSSEIAVESNSLPGDLATEGDRVSHDREKKQLSESAVETNTEEVIEIYLDDDDSECIVENDAEDTLELTYGNFPSAEDSTEIAEMPFEVTQNSTPGSLKTPHLGKRRIINRKKFRYMGDVQDVHFNSPDTAREAFNIAKETAEKYKRTTDILRKRLVRMTKRVENYQNTITDLKIQLKAATEFEY